MQCQMVQWLDESRVNVQQFVDTKKLIRIWSDGYSWSFNLNLIIGIIKEHFCQKPLIWQVIWRPNRIFRFRPIGPELNCFIDNYWKNVSRLDFKVHYKIISIFVYINSLNSEKQFFFLWIFFVVQIGYCIHRQSVVEFYGESDASQHVTVAHCTKKFYTKKLEKVEKIMTTHDHIL